MLYSTELANQIETIDNSNKYLEAGIHENVSLVSARTEKSINGNAFLEVKFEKDGKVLTHTEWEPNKKDNETDEDYQSRVSRQVKRVLQILSCFYPKEALVFAGASYKEFAEWATNLLNAADKTKLVRVKIVYNNKGYTTLPSYCKFTFIEPMELPEGEKSKITILNIDQITRPIIADNEQKETNPLESNIESPKADDLPF